MHLAVETLNMNATVTNETNCLTVLSVASLMTI